MQHGTKRLTVMSNDVFCHHRKGFAPPGEIRLAGFCIPMGIIYLTPHGVKYSSGPAEGGLSPEASAPEWKKVSDCECSLCRKVDSLVENARHVVGEIFGLDVRKDVWRGPLDGRPGEGPDSCNVSGGQYGVPIAEPACVEDLQKQMAQADKRKAKTVLNWAAVIDGRKF